MRGTAKTVSFVFFSGGRTSEADAVVIREKCFDLITAANQLYVWNCIYMKEGKQEKDKQEKDKQEKEDHAKGGVR